MNVLHLIADTTNANLSTCTVNGHAASCSQAHAAALAFLIPLFLVIIVLAIFWFKALFHLIENRDVPNRALWLILVLVGSGFAGIIYSFAVKKPYERNKASSVNTSQPQTGAQPYSPVVQPITPQNQVVSPTSQPPQQPQPPQYPQLTYRGYCKVS